MRVLRSISASVVAVTLLAGCASPPPRVSTSTPTPAAPAAAPLPPVVATHVETRGTPPAYLAPAVAGGSPFCFDPESPTLRAAVKRAPFADDDRIDAAALADDVRDLHAAMKKLYAGYPELLQSTTFDVDRFFAEWERDVRAAGATITFDAGIVERLVTLRRHIRDNHLTVRGGTPPEERPELAFSEYQVPGRVVGLDEARCTFTGAEPVRGTTEVARVLTRSGLAELSTFSARSTAPFVDVRCGAHTARFERRPHHDARRDRGVPVYEWRTVGDATVITVRRLSGSPDDEALLARMATDAAAHARKPIVVFDFRGNGGGNDGYVSAWIEELVRGSWPAAYAELRVTGAATACGDWNNLVGNQIGYDRVDTPAGVAEREAFLRETPLGGRPADPVEVLDRAPSTSSAKHPYTGRVFALVDHGSASSGESAPNMLRLAMHATVLGERTGGFAELGNVRPYMMPRTGVFWHLGSKRNYFEAPRDGVGFPVDVILDGDLLEAPVEELLPLLKKLPKER
jgi:hypothetical protein